MSRTHTMFAAAGLAVAFMNPLAAQGTGMLASPSQGLAPTAEVPRAMMPAPVGLQSSASAVNVMQASLDDATGISALAARRRGEGEVLMIVGAAGIVTGILIEEGLISLLGAGVGLYGLYLHLR
jgi:hypothetical protein